jgi:hypothetical protein
LTPNLKEEHNGEDVQEGGNVCLKIRAVNWIMPDDKIQDNSVPGVPMVLTHLANSSFKTGHRLSLVILHIHCAIFNFTPLNFGSL